MLVVLGGIVGLIYPSAANLWNEYHQSRIIGGYAQAVEELDTRDYTQILQAAVEYNKRLVGDVARFEPDEADTEEYNNLLDITGTGIMAYLEIPKIKVKLAVYHGVDEAILQVAAGHIEGSSLPVGGVGTHIAISGHRGLTSASLFTHLDELEPGDKFYIQVLGQTMAYEIDQVDVVLPDDFEPLRIEKSEDYCTLITCTPYGVNSHRLLVRGTRVPYTPEAQAEYESASGGFEVDKDWVVVGVGCVGFLACAFMFARRFIGKKGEAEDA